MAVFVLGLIVLFAMTAHSDAAYCVCNSGLSNNVLQKNIDYACGAGADCTQIHSGAPCFNPDTVHDHCNYAVNSYFQRKAQAPTACDFAGTATVSQTAPTAASGCVYPSSASTAGSATPSTGGVTNTGGSIVPPGSTVSPGGGFGLAPTGSGFGSTDNAASATILSLSTTFTFMFFSLTLLLASFKRQ